MTHLKALAAPVAAAALFTLAGCGSLSRTDAVEAAAERLLRARPDLVAISHWPAAPWPGESIQARASFARLPQGAVVQAAWRGVAGGIQGKTGRVTLQPAPRPDPFTGLTDYSAVLSTGLKTGDALAYRIEVSAPGRSDPWASYEESVLVSPKGAELRGMWVQSWAPALFTAAQCKQLVDDARTANVNAICIEIRRRGDAFFNSSIEPKNPSIKPANFDPLAEILRLAHDTSGGKSYIQVHGWFVIYPVGKEETAQKHPDWATQLRDGSRPSGETIFDPGHPEVLQHTVDVIADCVANYNLDGVNYDYVRYLEGQEKPRPDALALYRKDKNLPADAEVDIRTDDWKEWVKVQPDGSVFQTIPTGFHPVSVARFNRLHNRPADSLPEADDPEWKQWKRDQVTGFVRKSYARINQIRPACMVSADTTGFGGIKTWETSAPMNAVFQNWYDWMNRHLIDANFHMGYKREHVEAQKKDYREWTTFMVDNDGGRFQVVGQGSYMNAPEAYRAQVEFARNLRAPGVIFYAYQGHAPKDANISREAWLEWAGKNVFPTHVPVPEMAWKKHPTAGLLCGTLKTPEGRPVDTARVYLVAANGLPPADLIATDIMTRTDGAGFFAFTRVPPGEYSVFGMDNEGRVYKSPAAAVAAGTVTEIP